MAGLTAPGPLPNVADIGRRWGWKRENEPNLARVAAAVEQGRPIGVYQDVGRRDWWPDFCPWPHHFERLEAWPAEANAANWEAMLAITDRLLVAPAFLQERVLVYRPPSLTLGVQCEPGVSAAELTEYVTALLAQHGLSPLSLTALAAVVAHRHEPGLIDFAEERAIPFLTYQPAKLPPFPGPAGRPAAVCEAAALLAAGVREWLVPRTDFGQVTLAVARRPTA